jgi:hypothetical protein
MVQLDEVKATLEKLGDKLDMKLDDHIRRITRLEVENENQAREIETLKRSDLERRQDNTAGRRWAVTTTVAVLALIAAVLLPLVTK